MEAPQLNVDVGFACSELPVDDAFACGEQAVPSDSDIVTTASVDLPRDNSWDDEPAQQVVRNTIDHCMLESIHPADIRKFKDWGRDDTYRLLRACLTTNVKTLKKLEYVEFERDDARDDVEWLVVRLLAAERALELGDIDAAKRELKEGPSLAQRQRNTPAAPKL